AAGVPDAILAVRLTPLFREERVQLLVDARQIVRMDAPDPPVTGWLHLGLGDSEQRLQVAPAVNLSAAQIPVIRDSLKGFDGEAEALFAELEFGFPGDQFVDIGEGSYPLHDLGIIVANRYRAGNVPAILAVRRFYAVARLKELASPNAVH